MLPIMNERWLRVGVLVCVPRCDAVPTPAAPSGGTVWSSYCPTPGPPCRHYHPPVQPAATPACDGGGGAGAEDDTVTPLACLFDRFDALAIANTGRTTAPPRTARAPPSAAGAAAGADTAAAAPQPPKSPLGPARRVPGAPRRAAATAPRGPWPAAGARVSFGTPAVHQYRGGGEEGGGGGGGGAQQGAAETHMWSNAGHTPYSLAGSSAHGGRAHGLLGVSPLCGPDFDAALEAEEGAGEACIGESRGCGQGGSGGDVGSSDEEGAGPRLQRESTGSFKFASAAQGAAAEDAAVRTPALGVRASASDEATPTMFGAPAGRAEVERGGVEALPFAREQGPGHM